MKKNILIVLLLAIVVVIVIGLIFNNKKENSDQNILQNEIKSDEFMNRIVSTDSNEINAIKNEINATGQTDIYQIEEEYDGRKIIQVKPDVQYQVALAGIIKMVFLLKMKLIQYWNKHQTVVVCGFLKAQEKNSWNC